MLTRLRTIADQAEAALQGEPARFVTYGAAIVVWGVVGLAHALGYHGFGPTLSLNDAMIDATAAAALLTEAIRYFVYSPATVARVTSAATEAAIARAASQAAGGTGTGSAPSA